METITLVLVVEIYSSMKWLNLSVKVQEFIYQNKIALRAEREASSLWMTNTIFGSFILKGIA